MRKGYEKVVEVLSEGVRVFVGSYEMNEIEEAMQAAEDHGIECKFEDDYIKPIS